MAEETNTLLALEPAHVQARAIREGKTSSRALLELFIDRIESLDGDINAVVTRDFDAARRAADQADAVLARGDPIGPLHGLPITIKDALETQGLRSTGGADDLKDYVPTRDAPVVRKLKDAGAIVIGKTNLPEWSGDAQAYNRLFGTTRNPWNLERGPGGSSGGAAAAVATGMTAFEIGTDIGGSIRFPRRVLRRLRPQAELRHRAFDRVSGSRGRGNHGGRRERDRPDRALGGRPRATASSPRKGHSALGRASRRTRRCRSAARSRVAR